MAYKEKIIQRLEGLLRLEGEVNRLLLTQDIYLMMHPDLAKGKAPEVRSELSSFSKATEHQEENIKELIGSLKGSAQDVY